MELAVVSVILLALFVAESITIYSRAYFWSYVFLIAGTLAIMRYLHLGFYDLTYLLFYPIGCLIWMPIFWYLSMLKTSRQVAADIVTYGSIESAYRNGRTSYRNIKQSDETGKYEVDIPHPPAVDIINNSIFFPVSIVVFFGENLMSMAYNSLVVMMESIRKSFSDSINNRFKV